MGALVALGFAPRPLDLPALLQFLIVAPAAVVSSFAVAWLVVVRLRFATCILSWIPP